MNSRKISAMATSNKTLQKPAGSTSYRPARPSLARTAGELAAFIRSSRPAFSPAVTPPGNGHVVLVLPVIGRGDEHTAHFRTALDDAGYRSVGWGLGCNFGPTDKLLDGAGKHARSLADQHGAISIVGFSMGGLFARWLAVQDPDRVRHVVTVCSPFRSPADSAFLPIRPLFVAWPNANELQNEIGKPLPVPATCIYSRRDGIVSWRSCLDPMRPEDCFEIAGPHVTITRDPAVFEIVARRLSQHWIPTNQRDHAPERQPVKLPRKVRVP